MVDEDRSCQISVQVGSRLHIAGKPRSGRSVSSVRCGSRSRPWLLEAQTGQQINISLLDFSGHGRRTQLDTRGLVSDDCSPAHVQYGYIVDKTNKNNVSICSTAAQQRHKHVYQSTGNVVEVVLAHQQPTDDESYSPNFLLSFEGTLNHNNTNISRASLRFDSHAWFPSFRITWRNAMHRVAITPARHRNLRPCGFAEKYNAERRQHAAGCRNLWRKPTFFATFFSNGKGFRCGSVRNDGNQALLLSNLYVNLLVVIQRWAAATWFLRVTHGWEEQTTRQQSAVTRHVRDGIYDVTATRGKEPSASAQKVT